ncbi:quinone oxidoreductase [Pseudaminobacter sp. 19-2017]|uniref:Quinone oxidoreductase n=1 Tax=Pseudaminobacter soli (ex Zhang et al. 2022) TaxID=2831468 RepID=A0A942DVF7_9HYPH|nr:quinone oxidoreductase [Pseudaminobacter soli]MBS3647368.1 quinone oxidoreductase [Pseudaminobacter soli]
MSKAIRIHANGGPDVLKYEDADPGRPGPGQVLLRHTAVGLNFIDVYYRTGLYPPPNGLPLTPGGEAAGVVEEAGEDVDWLKPGDRVAYVSQLGAYAEHRVIDADRLVRIPDGVSDEQAAASMLKGLTAEYLLRRTYAVKPGDTILFHAAAGGVGLFAGQWARHLGATVIGTAGSPDKVELARQHGYDHVINYRDTDFVTAVKEITGGGLCEVVYDSVGKDTFPGSLDCLKRRGMFVSFGQSSGQIPPFNMGILAQKGSLYATRPSLFAYIATREELEAAAAALFDVMSRGIVKAVVNQRYPLAEAARAHEDLEARRTTGATVLIP